MNPLPGFKPRWFKASTLKSLKAPSSWFSLHTVFATAILLLCSTPGHAAPQVEGFDLVQEVRTGRTTFEYTFVLRVNADWASYIDGSFIVSSTSAVTKVTKAIVSVGAIDGGQFLRTSDTFKVQHDRTQPFDRGAIKFDFAGVPAPGAVWQSETAVRVGAIRFLEERGRPLHPAAVPIQSENPTVGANLILDADLFGDVSTASYQLLAENGTVLREAVLASGGIPGSFSSEVQIPAQKFHILIAAVDGLGRRVEWQSARVYAPALSKLATVTPPRIKAGTTGALKLQMTVLSRDSIYDITLRLPDGWTGGAGPWRVQVKPGVPIEISTNITVPKDAKILASQTVGVLATSATGDRQTMNISFEVE